ncbi:flavodoxin family protein [Candidatus Izemoplasma sp. B36]|uniref:flavodoxin family protein n=1 Tax=Candidatus Izemoplasma sp. B36 TaxID=3242468 RepID=UPI0035590B44
MKVLIIYDSYYGNTLKVANNYNELLKDYHPELIKVDVVTQSIIDTYEIIIIGSPTRAFNMTKKIKRTLKKFDYKNKKIFVFDTRANPVLIDQKFLVKLMNRFGYAAEKMEKVLVKKNAQKIMDYKYYYVKDSEGPLVDDYQSAIKKDVASLIQKFN